MGKYEAVKLPLGINVLSKAIALADSCDGPEIATHYDPVRLKRLITVCFFLQRIAGDKSFFLSCRDAAIIMNTHSPNRASAMLDKLVEDGILKVAVKGVPGRRKATSFYFCAQINGVRKENLEI
jgi:hypothetical protein